MDDETQRFFDTEIPEPELDEGDLSASSDALSVSFAQVDSAEDYEAMADQLSRAADHCRRAAELILDDDIDAGCSHGIAAQGHVQRALRLFEDLSVRHAAWARVDQE